MPELLPKLHSVAIATFWRSKELRDIRIEVRDSDTVITHIFEHTVHVADLRGFILSKIADIY